MAYDWLWDLGKEVVKGAVPAVVGGVISSNATDKAVEAQTAAGDKALALQKEMYEQSRADLAPYRESGNAANQRLSELMGLAKPKGADIRANLLKNHSWLASEPAATDSTTGQVFPASDGNLADIRRMYQTDPNDMSAQAKEKRRNLFKIDQMMRDFKDGDVNPYTGEKFDLNRQLDFYRQQANFEDTAPRSSLFGTQALLSPEEAQKITDERETLYRQTYQPSKSKQGLSGMISNLAPVIAGGLLAAPLAGAMAGLGGAAMPASHGVGMLANKLGSSLISNLGSSLASGVKR